MPFPLRFPGSSKQEEAVYRAVEIDPNGSNSSKFSPATEVVGWPTEPKHGRGFSFWIFADLILLLWPIAFIGRVILT